MKCKEMQEKENVKLQLKNKKKQNLKEKGITLIALVVTIIILLILAGVTLNMAMSGDGLFSKARNAADKYKKAQEDEAKLISEIGKEMNSEYVGAYVTGYEPKSGSFEITKEQSGVDDIVGTQTFTTGGEGTLKWRIWDYDGTTLRIILDRPTTANLQLKGAAGYNNGVYLMNEICRKCFSSEDEGVTVRNLRRSDIEAISNYDYTKFKHRASGDNTWQDVLDDVSEENLIYYGETRKFEEYYQAPTMWINHDSTWAYRYDSESKKGTGDKSTEIPWEQEYGSDNGTGVESTSAGTEFTQSNYYHKYKYEQGEFKNLKYYDLLFKNGENQAWMKDYWLASRCVFLGDTSCNFEICIFDTSEPDLGMQGGPTLNSSGLEVKSEGSLRPIVSINLALSGYKLIQNDSENEYKLTKE